MITAPTRPASSSAPAAAPPAARLASASADTALPSAFQGTAVVLDDAGKLLRSQGLIEGLQDPLSTTKFWTFYTLLAMKRDGELNEQFFIDNDRDIRLMLSNSDPHAAARLALKAVRAPASSYSREVLLFVGGTATDPIANPGEAESTDTNYGMCYFVQPGLLKDYGDRLPNSIREARAACGKGLRWLREYPTLSDDAKAGIRAYEQRMPAFTDRMNFYAKMNGMNRTNFVSPVGYPVGNPTPQTSLVLNKFLTYYRDPISKDWVDLSTLPKEQADAIMRDSSIRKERRNPNHFTTALDMAVGMNAMIHQFPEYVYYLTTSTTASPAQSGTIPVGGREDSPCYALKTGTGMGRFGDIGRKAALCAFNGGVLAYYGAERDTRDNFVREVTANVPHQRPEYVAKGLTAHNLLMAAREGKVSPQTQPQSEQPAPLPTDDQFPQVADDNRVKTFNDEVQDVKAMVASGRINMGRLAKELSDVKAKARDLGPVEDWAFNYIRDLRDLRNTLERAGLNSQAEEVNAILTPGYSPNAALSIPSRQV